MLSYQLSDDAIFLLKSTKNTPKIWRDRGTICTEEYPHREVEGNPFRREPHRWETALRELISRDLCRERDPFDLTQEGQKIANELNL
jgi:hypothetical protein